MLTKILSLVKQSPIAVLTSAEASAAAVLAFLVVHGVISAELAKTYGPYFTLVYIAAFGLAKWWNVMPWSKGRTLAEQLETGMLTDADHHRIVAGVLEVLEDTGLYQPKHLVGDAHPDAVAVGAPSAPTLAAGASQ